MIILVFKGYIYTISSIRMKSCCTSTTMGSLIVSFFRLTMSRDTRGAGMGANNGNAADMRTMFTDLMREMLWDVQRAAPNGGNGGGPIVQVPRVDFAKLNKDYTSLGGKSFHGMESATDVQDWLDSCECIFEDLGIEDAMKR